LFVCLFVCYKSVLPALWLCSTSTLLQGCVDIAIWRLALALQQRTYVYTWVSQCANDVTLAYYSVAKYKSLRLTI